MPILQVSYQVDGFIDKNKDLLYRDLSQLMFTCERKLLKKFFPEGLAIILSYKWYFIGNDHILTGDPEKVTMKRPITTGSQFKVNCWLLLNNFC